MHDSRTVVDETKIENKIGDALVQRIIRAHRDKTPWKCCIMIPLLPGFSFPVDHSDASAVSPIPLLQRPVFNVSRRFVLSSNVRIDLLPEGLIPSSPG